MAGSWRKLAFSLFAAALWPAAAHALVLTSEEVEAGAARLYQERIEAARQRFELDADPVFLARVTRIASRLIGQSEREQGGAGRMIWEVHTTADPEENASCMAGGKLLIGHDYARRLELNDAELAMLIAHEMEHALLRHNLKEMREALRLEPERARLSYADLEYAVDHDEPLMRKLDSLDAEQEFEADRAGLLLAVRAGWSGAALANYFRKLVRHDPQANFDRSEHPAPARRWRAAQELVKQLNPIEAEQAAATLK